MDRHVSHKMALARHPPPAPGRGERSGGSSPLTFRYPIHRNNVPSTRTWDHTPATTRANFVVTLPAAIRHPSRPHKIFDHGLRDAAIAALRPQCLHHTAAIETTLATTSWRQPVTTRYVRVTIAGVHRPDLSIADGPPLHPHPYFTYDRPAARYPTHPLAEDKTSLDMSLAEAEAADVVEAASAAKASVVAAAAPSQLLVR